MYIIILRIPLFLNLTRRKDNVPLVPYASVDEALKNKYSAASSYLSLNGTWKFDFFDTPEGTPADVDPRPSFPDEYLAVTGNGGGAPDDYW